MVYPIHPQIVAAVVGLAAGAMGLAVALDADTREAHRGFAAALIVFGYALATAAVCQAAKG